LIISEGPCTTYTVTKPAGGDDAPRALDSFDLRAGPIDELPENAEELLEHGRGLGDGARRRIDLTGERPWVKGLVRIRQGIETITTCAGWIAKWLVVAVFAVGIVNVILRYYGRWSAQNLTSNRWIETQWYIFGLIFLLGFPYILREQINPRVDFWYANFSDKRKALIDFVGHLLFLLPFTWLAMRVLWTPVLTSFGRNSDGSWDSWRVWESWEQSPDPDGWPRAPIKGAILLGFFLLFLQTIAELIKTGFVLVNRADLAGRAERHVPLRVE